MKKIFAISVFAALLAGCTLTGMNSNVRRTEPAPANTQAQATPAAKAEEPIYELDAQNEPRASEGAVVSRESLVPAKVEPAVDADFDNGMALFEAGKLREARLALTASLNNFLGQEAEAKALATLRDINGKIFLTAGEDGDLKLYVVKNGDSLGKIAAANGTTVEMIQRLNGLKGTMIQVGQTLKVLGGKFELVVRRSTFTMDLLLDGAFIQRYEVGLGTGGSTPLGEFKVKNRIPQPADGSYPYGHEKHRLGSRWLGLASEAGHKGYGIHGCRPEEEKMIPGECSAGCVRMKSGDVEEIYDIVPVGTRLVVIEK